MWEHLNLKILPGMNWEGKATFMNAVNEEK